MIEHDAYMIEHGACMIIYDALMKTAHRLAVPMVMLMLICASASGDANECIYVTISLCDDTNLKQTR